MSTRLLWATLMGSVLLALYAGVGVLQGAMLFVGDRAQLNVALWGAVFVLALVLFAVSTITLWRHYMLNPPRHRNEA